MFFWGTHEHTHMIKTYPTYLNVFLELSLMLTRQLLVLTLELCDEDLPLDLLLLFQGQQLLLQLLLPHWGPHHASATMACTKGAWRLLTRRREWGHLLRLLLVMVHAQVHGDCGWRETQGQRRIDVHCGAGERKRDTEIGYFVNGACVHVI